MDKKFIFTVGELKKYFKQHQIPDDMPVACDGTLLQSIGTMLYSPLQQQIGQYFSLTTYGYRLKIFDLKKGEKPNIGDSNIAVYDELNRLWKMGVGLNVNGHFSDGLTLDIERYHRWTRLPILEKEDEKEEL